MSDNVVLYVNRLITSATLQSVLGSEAPGCYGEDSVAHTAIPSSSTSNRRRVDEHMVPKEEELQIQMVECRICQDEDHIENLETPCACSGSLKFAHRNCVQKWCNEKGDTNCEICKQLYRPNYTSPPPRPSYEDTAIDIRLLATATATAERHFLEADNDEYDTTNDSGVAFCRCAALILLGFLLLRHTLAVTSLDDASAIFSIFLVWVAGFLLPCYIIAWAITVLQRRRHMEEGAAEVAFILQSGQQQRLQFTIMPGPTMTTHQ